MRRATFGWLVALAASGCNHAAGGSCATGAPCPPDGMDHEPCGTADCSGTVDLCSSASHCGQCNHDCRGGACVDGLCQPVQVADSQATPRQIALDAQNLYWTNLDRIPSVSGNIMVQAKAGGSSTILASMQGGPGQILANGTGVFWNDTSSGKIMGVLGGTSQPFKVVGSVTQIVNFAIDSANAYYADMTTTEMHRVALVGGAPAQLTPPAALSPSGIATDGAYVYWTNSVQGTVVRAPVVGGAAEPLASNQRVPDALVLQDDNLYFVAGDNEIFRLPTAGGDPGRLVGPLARHPAGLVTDKDAIYWTHIEDGLVMRAAFSNAAVQTLASGQFNPFGIAVDETTVYWCNSGELGMGNGTIMRLAK